MGARDMPFVIGLGARPVEFKDDNIGIIEMFFEPGRLHQSIGHVHSPCCFDAVLELHGM